MFRPIMAAIVLLMSATTLGASAQQSATSGIDVQRAWARATPGAVKTGVAYLSIVNRGDAPDRLIGMSSPVAAKAEVHDNEMENGIMKMRPVGPVTINSGQSVEFKPGGDHIMLIELKQPLREGENFPITLIFEKGGEVKTSVIVERAGAMGINTMDHKSMPHMNMDDGKADPEKMKK